jgi:uncharacterized protein (DUF1501 family)
MNRALSGLSDAGKASPKGLAMDAVVPLVMRGKAPVLSWIPKVYNRQLADSTVSRLLDLYAATDARLAKSLAEGMEIQRVAEAGALAGAVKSASAATSPAAPAMTSPAQPAPRLFKDFTDAAEAAGRFLSSAEGPRIGALSYNGWDTHANEGVIKGVLGNRLAALDAALKAFHETVGAAWKDTVVVVVTEFGRTAQVNGTDGTDHGMATVALILGGSVRGGRMLANWPGLRDADLYERRDLKPTTDLRALLKGVLRDHVGVPDGALGSVVFPDSATIKPVPDLIA